MGEEKQSHMTWIVINITWKVPIMFNNYVATSVSFLVNSFLLFLDLFIISK